VANTSATSNVKHRWPFCIFLFLSAALSWTVWLWPTNRGAFLLSGFGFWFKIPLPFLQLSIGSCLPGVLAVVWTLCEGKDQFRRMLATLTKWRTPLQWYIVAVALPLGVFLVALGAVLLFFPSNHSFFSFFSFFAGINLLVRLMMILPFAPLWEEIAWRAFALAKLESRYSRLASSILLGLYWGMWHIPFWRVQFPSVPISLLLAAIVNVIAMSVIFAYFYHRSSESLPVVILLHAMYDALGPQVSLVVSSPYVQMRVIYTLTVLSVCLSVAVARALRRMGGTS